MVHVIPAEKLCAAWHDFKGEALPSINTVVPLAVTAAHHMTGGLGCSGGAGGSCRRHQVISKARKRHSHIGDTELSVKQKQILRVHVC